MNFQFKTNTEIIGICWITFVICDNKTNKKTLGYIPKYLDEREYSLYVDAFEKNNPLFNYYGPTYFDRTALRKICKDIYAIQDKYKRIDAMQLLIDFTKINMAYTDLYKELQHMQEEENFNFQSLLKNIITLGYSIIEYIEIVIKENRVLLIEGL